MIRRTKNESYQNWFVRHSKTHGMLLLLCQRSICFITTMIEGRFSLVCSIQADWTNTVIETTKTTGCCACVLGNEYHESLPSSCLSTYVLEERDRTTGTAIQIKQRESRKNEPTSQLPTWQNEKEPYIYNIYYFLWGKIWWNKCIFCESFYLSL